jgi:DNA-binding NarL/FixJ family response regulator
MIRIVIYDDHQQRCESLNALIMLAGDMQCVGIFHDCRNVVEEMRRLKPDIVLMDISMPEVDGISGVQMIKKEFPGIRIIMQTIFSDEARIFASLQAGAEGYILKDTNAEKIMECIRQVYNGGAFMTPSVALRVIKYFDQSKTGVEDYKLTQKEKEVLSLLSDGNSYKMVADKLGIAFNTVNAHIRRIYEKLHVHSVGEAVSLALKRKLV